MIVFRDTSEVVHGGAALAELRASLSRAGDQEPAATFAAAEIECALADLGDEQTERAALVTDILADAWIRREQTRAEPARQVVEALRLPARLERRIPEGFAYYALSPESYVELARDLAQAGATRAAHVIGIRSIGVGLSAIVAAELRRLGMVVTRSTVRPRGHPWAREANLGPAELEQLAQRRETEVLVVDEGPGLSGSSFLSVAEALLRAGVPAERISLFCSHAFEPSELRAEDAALRFARFRVRAPPPWRAPENTQSLAGGDWRALRFENVADYPACWSAFERVKYRTPDGRTLVKFEGFGRYVEPSLRRASALGEAGWAPPVRRFAPGYLGYEWIEGRVPEASERARLVPALCDYLAFRAGAFQHPGVDPRPIEEMLRVNVAEAFGIELPDSLRLEVAQPVEPDARLALHEWVIARDGAVLKTDSADHASDHFFPGPVDVAWDLAGAIVEWELERRDRQALLDRYRGQTGDDAEKRLLPYLAAYAAFRVGYAALAGSASPHVERARWGVCERAYRARLLRALSEVGVTSP